MPDATMCYGTKGEVVCPHRDSCYRYTAPHNEFRQSYFVEIPLDPENNVCHYYWNDQPNT